MNPSKSLLAVVGLSLLWACQQVAAPLTPGLPPSLAGKYTVLSLTEEPYTDNAINNLVLFDGTHQDCAAQPATLYFAANGVLTTTVAPACKPSVDWLGSVGLMTASHWVVKGNTLGITPKRGLAKAYSVQLINKQLELRWLGVDTSFVGLYGEAVTYSLKLKHL